MVWTLKPAVRPQENPSRRREMDKMDVIRKLWEQFKTAYGSRQTMESFRQLRDHLPKRLPPNASVELPPKWEWAPIPQEKLREIFPELSWLIDEGVYWEVRVDYRGYLWWRYPLNKCTVCGGWAKLIASEMVPFLEWNCYITDVWRCPDCGHEWWDEWEM
jgi:hypothetical protein